MYWLGALIASHGFLLGYHICEETVVAIACAVIAWRAWSAGVPGEGGGQVRERCRLAAAGFFILAGSSLIHALVHAFCWDQNLLYQTLLGYCLGLLVLVVAIAADRPASKRYLPCLYLPLLLLLLPGVSRQFPRFAEFRPLVWISIAYCAGLVSMLLAAVYYRTREVRVLLMALGFGLVCISSIFLFFPAPIGSTVWLHGHLFRPAGFLLLLAVVDRRVLRRLGGSILYRVLAAFVLLAAVPLLIFGTVVCYENISPIDSESRRMLVFLLLLVTFASAFVFGLGVIIRLVRPLLLLKDAVDRLDEEGWGRTIPVRGNDEIGELSHAFNQMTQRLSRAIEEQERLCRLAATGELAATLAHEIKNPLNAIGGAASYIGKHSPGRLVQEFVGVIAEEVGRINRLCTTLLGFARPLQPDLAPVDCNRLVREVVTLMGKEAQELGIAVCLDLADRLPAALCDANQVKQVLINLLVNAFDALAAGGTVRITTSASREAVRLAVEDDGPGIDEERLALIFNPFFTTKTRGTGLGLAISKKIAREHGGDLEVASEVGRGSVFTLVLPQAAGKKEEDG